jgi:AcrR family transcriptional regulator
MSTTIAAMASTATAADRPRRTQRERREATIAKLIKAAVDALVEVGFGGASVKEICARAGVSDGGLFRHFDTRLDLIVAAADHIAQHEIADARARIEALPAAEQPLELVIRELRESVRSPRNRVWHELLAAARTHTELRERLEPSARRYIQAVRGLFADLPGVQAISPEHRDVWLALLLHLFDGEAIFAVVAPNPRAEQRLLEFVASLVLTDTTANDQINQAAEMIARRPKRPVD